jgi:hypothetical protein
MRECYERAQAIVDDYEVILGPECPPCSHNTLNFAAGLDGKVTYPHERPLMLGGEP